MIATMHLQYISPSAVLANPELDPPGPNPCTCLAGFLHWAALQKKTQLNKCLQSIKTGAMW